MKIVARYEKGMKFLDLTKSYHRGIDEDGTTYTEECWEVVIWENERNLNEHKVIEFGSEMMARMFISNNDWKEQVL